MYKKVFYNIKKMKKCGGGAIKKKVKKKILTEPGLEPTTSGFEIHLAKHYYIAITKYE